MSSKITYYVWKDDVKSTDTRWVTYVTDYLEKDKQTGKIWVDGFGWISATLLASGHSKEQTISKANSIFENLIKKSE